jgi:hypothetical protein
MHPWLAIMQGSSVFLCYSCDVCKLILVLVNGLQMHTQGFKLSIKFNIMVHLIPVIPHTSPNDCCLMKNPPLNEATLNSGRVIGPSTPVHDPHHASVHTSSGPSFRGNQCTHWSRTGQPKRNPASVWKLWSGSNGYHPIFSWGLIRLFVKHCAIQTLPLNTWKENYLFCVCASGTVVGLSVMFWGAWSFWYKRSVLFVLAYVVYGCCWPWCL